MISIRRQGMLAATPIILYALAMTLSQFWSPALLQRSNYSWVDLGLFVILAAGGLWGLRRGIPLWSYSWIAFCIGSTAKLLLSAVMGQGTMQGAVATTFPLALLALYLAQIVLCSLLGRRGTARFGILALLLVLLYGVLPFSTFAETSHVPAGTASMLTYLSITWSIFEFVIVLVALLRFLRSSGNTQRRWLYPLAFVVFIEPVLFACKAKLYNPTMPSSSVVWTFAGNWLIAGIGLLLVWGLSKAVTKSERKDESPTSAT